jgi:hypothetical protein
VTSLWYCGFPLSDREVTLVANILWIKERILGFE